MTKRWKLKAVQFGTIEEIVERTPKTASEAPFSAALSHMRVEAARRKVRWF